MKLLKFKVMLQRHRKTIIIILIVLGAIIGFTCFNRVIIPRVIENQTMFGVVGTLLGALIGGAFSLMGSVWVQLLQQKNIYNIKRKNIIYSPLYDELVEIQNIISEQNQFPTLIIFEKGVQTCCPHPQFAAWGRIKRDTRYLEVPTILKKQMEKLETAVKAYMEIRTQANRESEVILNNTLRENSLETCSSLNIGDIISSDILASKKTDIYAKSMEFRDEKTLEDTMRKSINEIIYDKAESNQVIIEVRRRYKEWLNIQQQTITLLDLLIKQVIQKYED